MQEHDVTYVFKSLEEVCVGRALDMRTRTTVMVPEVDVFLCGTPCVNLSAINTSARKAKQHIQSIQNCVGKTGEGFATLVYHLERNKPKLLLWENVTAVTNAKVEQGVSDAHYILGVFEECGYKCQMVVVKAQEHCLGVNRSRIYVIGFRGDTTSICRVPRLLGSLKMAPMPFEYVLGDMRSLPFLPSKHRSQEESAGKDNFRDEHLQYFDHNDMAYPPVFSELREWICDDLAQVLLSQTPRKAELTYFASRTEPFPDTLGTPQFFDSNMSLRYLVTDPDSSSSIFQNHVPCLTTHSEIVMRVKHTNGDESWRVLHGADLLRLIGYGPPQKEYSMELLSRLSGNAFSGFSVAVVLLASVASLGHHMSETWPWVDRRVPA